MHIANTEDELLIYELYDLIEEMFKEADRDFASYDRYDKNRRNRVVLWLIEPRFTRQPLLELMDLHDLERTSIICQAVEEYWGSKMSPECQLRLAALKPNVEHALLRRREWLMR